MSSKFPFWPVSMSRKTKVPAATTELGDGQSKESSPTSRAKQQDGCEQEAELSLSSSSAAPNDNRPYRTFASATQTGYVAYNPRKVNQDRVIKIKDFGDVAHALFGVFDGHGLSGHEVSEFVAQTLPQYLLPVATGDGDEEEAIKQGFRRMSDALEANRRINSSSSGTTAVVCYVNCALIFTANAGDSRAILGRATTDGKIIAIPLSTDHKPDRPDEKERILRLHGRVTPCRGQKGEAVGPPRVWLPDVDLPGLAMSRSFGDFIARPIGVTYEPEIDRTLRTALDKYLIIASDGVWEFISNQDAVDIVRRCATPDAACQALTRESTKRWNQEEDATDDISCVVVFL